MKKWVLIVVTFAVVISCAAVSVRSQTNVVYGELAGGSLTTGGSESFFGYSAGFSTTTGGANSFFGAWAGFGNVNGYYNSFFGQYAGANNASGHFNTFLGKSSGYFNTTGEENTFVGNYSGVSNQSGGYDNESGSHNSALGTHTKFAAPDLDYSTAIGAGSTGLSSNSITLGRKDAQDLVRIPGMLVLTKLSYGGFTSLCRTASTHFIALCSSSARYKSNIHTFDSGLDLIRKLRPVSFNWRDGGIPDFGLIAEDVYKVEPLLTTLNDNGEVEGVKYDRIAVVAINAINEQQRYIEDLEKKIEALKTLVCTRKSKAEICQPNVRR